MTEVNDEYCGFDHLSRNAHIETTGVTPERVILATAAIRSRRAQALRDAGFEVIEPEGAALG